MNKLLNKCNGTTLQGHCKPSGSGARKGLQIPLESPFAAEQASHRELVRCSSSPAPMEHNEYEGYAVKELSVTADLIQSFVEEVERPGTLGSEPWVTQLIGQHPHSKVVFDAHGDGHSMPQHLSTGLSGDHLVSISLSSWRQLPCT